MKSNNSTTINNLLVICGYGLIALGLLSLLSKILINYL